MPNDTLWLNNTGDYVVLDSGTKINDEDLKLILTSKSDELKTYVTYNSKNNDSTNKINRELQIAEKKIKEAQFEKDRLYYERIGNYIEILIIIGFFATIIYFIRKANWKRKNPFADDSDWIEIGSGPFIDASDEEIENYRRIQERKKLYPPTLIYNGRKLNFSTEELRNVLSKKFLFYNTLSNDKKIVFIQRIQKFIKTKDFKIHDRNGFKEMPILISATAIQLSFGLEDYLLEHYKNIHIFPTEFLGLEPNIRFLVGNVSKNNINISWKHFLLGYENSKDGHNVGIHEMAHAYYCQLIIHANSENHFKHTYKDFRTQIANTIALDKNKMDTLFSENAHSNEQEFWGESAELFFEKPNELKMFYPDLYAKISALLNQDLAQKIGNSTHHPA